MRTSRHKLKSENFRLWASSECRVYRSFIINYRTICELGQENRLGAQVELDKFSVSHDALNKTASASCTSQAVNRRLWQRAEVQPLNDVQMFSEHIWFVDRDKFKMDSYPTLAGIDFVGPHQQRGQRHSAADVASILAQFGLLRTLPQGVSEWVETLNLRAMLLETNSPTFYWWKFYSLVTHAYNNSPLPGSSLAAAAAVTPNDLYLAKGSTTLLPGGAADLPSSPAAEHFIEAFEAIPGIVFPPSELASNLEALRRVGPIELGSWV
ncbi:hypothetical protein Pmar_PMAR021015 [Perkinsus marinus ATCC 50983]|uniref:Uncharacterized protein n=1 Tax=Perkinsus marinus (strain ATCC 50983 / TXsc) TaxID=423536 RepID=C5KG63_PERM5|nr:hypothetical protein Pmar_PMAR021015 [Perkinsus marinus ATCC 50983]EER16419.1 hypothetical protein Pmar_PMAR021015 [Perkinsus marinus ATCC 50983]|eukprot:XP_002784623.1 hypothetical protein Pmar_PMAR021015 [Perkinsus marinus ATCC 50983]